MNNEIKRELEKRLNIFRFDNEMNNYSFIIMLLNTEEKMKKMIDFIDNNRDIEKDDIYFYSFKLANLPIYPRNDRIMHYVKKYNLLTRDNNFVED